MSVCPPGLVFNPNTLRCVKAEGRRGKRLQSIPAFQRTRVAAVPVYDALPEFARSLTRSFTQSRRPTFTPPTFTRRLSNNSDGCPEGKILNPATGKCVKVGGRVQRRIDRGPLGDEDERSVPVFYTRKASKVPLGEREVMRNWISSQCSNSEEPLRARISRP